MLCSTLEDSEGTECVLTTETPLSFPFLPTERASRTSVMVLSEKSDSEQEDKE